MKPVTLIQKKPCPDNGFTLIELMVVIVVVGVLTAIGLPTYVSQIGKARESEAKISLGAVARSQQAYHLENQTFAQSLNELQLVASVESKYYELLEPTIASDKIVKHQAVSLNGRGDLSRNFAAGVYHSAGLFDIIICQSAGVAKEVNVPDDNIRGECTNSGERVQ